MPDILLVAATERELGRLDGLACGVGPVEAAAATARALALRPVAAVLHVGVAGGRGLPFRSLVIGAESVYCDLAAAIPVVSQMKADALLVEAARKAVPDAPILAIGTSAAVGGALHDVPVEAMEGFAVLRAAALAGVPAVEVRAISFEIGDGDRSRWDIPGALASLHAVLPRLLAAIDAAVQR